MVRFALLLAAGGRVVPSLAADGRVVPSLAVSGPVDLSAALAPDDWWYGCVPPAIQPNTSQEIMHNHTMSEHHGSQGEWDLWLKVNTDLDGRFRCYERKPPPGSASPSNRFVTATKHEHLSPLFWLPALPNSFSKNTLSLPSCKQMFSDVSGITQSLKQVFPFLKYWQVVTAYSETQILPAKFDASEC